MHPIANNQRRIENDNHSSEFQAAKDDGVVWKFNRDSITENEGFELEFRIKAQYQQMFSNIILPQGGGNVITSEQGQAKSGPEVIKLFD